MNNRRFFMGLRSLTLLAICGALLLSACTPVAQKRRISGLAPCTAAGSLFGTLPFDQWTTRYHGTVNDVVEAHLASISGIASMPLECTADDYASVVPPSQPLQTLARGLPAWNTAARLDALSETDAAAVLLEFLRVYECSLNERRHYLPILATRDPAVLFNRGKYNKVQEEQRDAMARELDLARPALDRTLAIMAGFDQLRPLSIDLECVKRASLDVRNVLGLAAEASACLPRSWDAHGSLRDLSE